MALRIDSDYISGRGVSTCQHLFLTEIGADSKGYCKGPSRLLPNFPLLKTEIQFNYALVSSLKPPWDTAPAIRAETP